MSADLADLRAWLAELSPDSTEALFDTRAVRALLAERDAAVAVLAEPTGPELYRLSCLVVPGAKATVRDIIADLRKRAGVADG